MTLTKTRNPSATLLVKTSTVGDITTEFFAETEAGPALRWRKTCVVCGMAETFSKGAGQTDMDVFARHALFAGQHYRLHGVYQLGPDSSGTLAAF